MALLRSGGRQKSLPKTRIRRGRNGPRRAVPRLDPSAELTGSAPADNPASDPFAPTVSWGDESPTVVWPWGVDPARQQPVTWGSPPAPGAMDFPAAEPLPAAPDVDFGSAPGPVSGPVSGPGSGFEASAVSGFQFGPRIASDALFPAVPAPPPASGRRRLLIVAGAVLVVMLGGGGLGLALRGGGGPEPGVTVQQQAGGQAGNAGEPTAAPATSTSGTTTATTPASSPPTTPPTTSPTPSPTADVQAEALAELEQIYDGDRGSVSFNGQYAAQMASKYPGITDKLQTTASGSHRFLASDILAEYRELSTGHGGGTHPVVLLKSTDYGKRQLKNGHVLWVTFALGDFPTADSVTAWCNREFADLSPDERLNQCAVRRLQPPE
jgi:hypothetical protein